jgi:hypothetical protein
MQHPSSAYGRDLYEVLLADYPARTAAWEDLPPHMHIVYEKAAQALNVRLGFIEAISQLILIVHENSVSPVRDVIELASYIDTRLVPQDRFELHLTENGQEVGYGWYKVGMNGRLFAYEERGKALDLTERFAPEQPMNVRRLSLPLHCPIHGGMCS